MLMGMEDLDVCGNCGRWREEHYAQDGTFIADRFDFPCVQYIGTAPDAERRGRKQKELSSVRAARQPQYGPSK